MVDKQATFVFDCRSGATCDVFTAQAAPALEYALFMHKQVGILAPGAKPQ